MHVHVLKGGPKKVPNFMTGQSSTLSGNIHALLYNSVTTAFTDNFEI